MTTDREAMTLERQAFEEWAASKPDDWFDEASAEAIAWSAWQTRADLSRAAEPVGVVDSLIGSHGGFSHAVFKASNVPVGTKLYAHPSEDARDAKRYRWLRDGSYQRTQAVTFAGHAYWDEELDAAIDAAIKQREPPTVTFAPPETEEDVMAYLRIARLHVKHAREFLQKAMESGQ
jgi:hypothetical protein